MGLFRDLAGLGWGPFHPHRWVSWEAWKGTRETCPCSSRPVACGRPISVTHSAINVSHLLRQSVSFQGQGPGCASFPVSPCLPAACSSLGSPVLASQRRRGSSARLHGLIPPLPRPSRCSRALCLTSLSLASSSVKWADNYSTCLLGL